MYLLYRILLPGGIAMTIRAPGLPQLMDTNHHKELNNVQVFSGIKKKNKQAK